MFWKTKVKSCFWVMFIKSSDGILYLPTLEEFHMVGAVSRNSFHHLCLHTCTCCWHQSLPSSDRKLLFSDTKHQALDWVLYLHCVLSILFTKALQGRYNGSHFTERGNVAQGVFSLGHNGRKWSESISRFNVKAPHPNHCAIPVSVAADGWHHVLHWCAQLHSTHHGAGHRTALQWILLTSSLQNNSQNR